MRKYLKLRANIALGLIFAFLVNTLGPICPIACSAEGEEFRLPAPGVMVGLSPAYSPAVLKGIKLDPQNPFRFHFFVDRGDTPTRGQVPPTRGHVAEAPIGDRNVSPGRLPSEAGLNVKATQRNNEDDDQELRTEATRLIKYFLASLTIPEKDLWVNLSPYEKDRIVPQEFGQTEMGRDLLAEDYLLKQITASLIYPESQLGKEFWAKVYAQAQAKYGTTNIPINTFNKVWIVPEKAVVYENGGTAFVLENHLKVMLEEDYLALEKNQTPTRGHVAEAPIGDRNVSRAPASVRQEGPSNLPSNEALNAKAPQVNNGSISENINALGSQIVREIVIPALTKEVNEGKNFAQLRQVFYSLILATWYKKKIKDSILNKVYSNRNKISGVNVSAGDKDRIYQEYLKAFKKGVYNYIKEDSVIARSPQGDEAISTVPRKYFSGGVNAAQISDDMAMVGLNKDSFNYFKHLREKIFVIDGTAKLSSSRAMSVRFVKPSILTKKLADGAMNVVKPEEKFEKVYLGDESSIKEATKWKGPFLTLDEIKAKIKLLLKGKPLNYWHLEASIIMLDKDKKKELADFLKKTERDWYLSYYFGRLYMLADDNFEKRYNRNRPYYKFFQVFDLVDDLHQELNKAEFNALWVFSNSKDNQYQGLEDDFYRLARSHGLEGHGLDNNSVTGKGQMVILYYEPYNLRNQWAMLQIMIKGFEKGEVGYFGNGSYDDPGHYGPFYMISRQRTLADQRAHSWDENCLFVAPDNKSLEFLRRGLRLAATKGLITYDQAKEQFRRIVLMEDMIHADKNGTINNILNQQWKNNYPFDHAMNVKLTNWKIPEKISDTGGIDLNPAQMSMQVKEEGQDFKFNFNDTEIDAAQVAGATFTIRTMTPVTDLPLLLGLSAQQS